MSTSGWRTYLIVDGFDRDGQAVPIVVGLIETAAGGVQLALRQGLDREPVILSLQAASQLIVNIRETLIERARISGESLGGEPS